MRTTCQQQRNQYQMQFFHNVHPSENNGTNLNRLSQAQNSIFVSISGNILSNFDAVKYKSPGIQVKI